MRAPPDTRSLTESSRTSRGNIRRRWRALARGAWMVCALLLLANFVASIPAYYQIMRTACTLANQGPCTDTSGQLTPDNVAALAHLHLSLTGYAAYFVTLDVVVSLLAWGVGLLIFWRKSDERMGLFVSLLLVLFGATGSGNTLLGVWAPTPSPPLLSHLLNLLSALVWIGLGAFLLTFPTVSSSDSFVKPHQRSCGTMDSLRYVCGDHLASFHNEGGENDLLYNFNLYISLYH